MADGRLPAAVVYGKDGTPLLSWRVSLLPYIEEQELYKQFKLDEPWDSPHNIRLLPHMPPDSKTLFSGSSDTTVLVWDLSAIPLSEPEKDPVNYLWWIAAAGLVLLTLAV